MLVGSVPLVIACAVRPPMASLQRPPDPMTAYCRSTVISACSDVNSNLTAVDKFAALEASNRSIGGTFRFTAADASSSSPVDDVAEGIGELVDVGRRTSGLLGLGLEIGLGGLLSPFGAGAFLLFFLLCSGQFGDERFLARAPNAEQGTYYQPRELETYEAPVDSMPEGDTTAPYPTFVRARPPTMRIAPPDPDATASRRRRDVARATAALLALAATAVSPLQSRALPEACLNGMMEQRQSLGMDPFAPPCDVVDPGPLPVYPIFAAQRTVEALLADATTFRSTARLGLPTGELQLPPTLSPTLFERLALAVDDGAALSDAGRSYVMAAYDANELLEFAERTRRGGGGDGEVCEYVDRSIEAARRCSDALSRVVRLLPTSAVAAQGQLTSR